MRSRLLIYSAVCLSAAIAPTHGQNFHAQDPNSAIVVPDSTVVHPEDHGKRAHTNHLLLVKKDAKTDFGGLAPSGNTPAKIYPIYLAGTTPAGSGIIAIVDAYDYPTAQNDFAVFSTQFGLPTNKLQVTWQGPKPKVNCGWNQEAALDIEWAHAMAPNAQIILVEAASNSNSDLYAAVDYATQLVTANGGKGEVSMSWGGGESSAESSNDSHFQNSNVVYIASSGDTGGVTEYPSASPWVVAAGGTSLNRNSDGSLKSETGWSGSGGGPSKYEPIPGYQKSVPNTSLTKRSIPDMSFDSDPNTGVAVYDSARCQGLSGWMVFGGTSVAAPSLAGIINTAGNFYAGSQTELYQMYGNRVYASSPVSTDGKFYDVLTGNAGGNSAAAGYDYVTGIGSSRGTGGK
jgi:subtilase family serine protease